MKIAVPRDGALLASLFELLPQQSRTSVKNMLSKGQVVVNGESVTAFDYPLKKGDTLEILPNVSPLPAPPARTPVNRWKRPA